MSAVPRPSPGALPLPPAASGCPLIAADLRAVIFLARMAAIGCVHEGYSRWAAELMRDARRLTALLNERAATGGGRPA